ncbi:chaperonin-containing T-complex member BBS12 [Discoglossus pictus]
MGEDGVRGRELKLPTPGKEIMPTNHPNTALNVKGHNGLQSLSTLAASVKAFLGPVKSCKFIFDQSTNESTLTCSSFRLLDSLDLTSSVGQLLNETIQAHHKRYKTGTTTLFFLLGAWSNAVLECLHQGVPVSLIVSVMLEGLYSCIEHVESSLQIPLHNVLLAKQCSMKPQTATDHVYVNSCDSKDRSSYYDNGAVVNSALEPARPPIKHIEHRPLHQPGRTNFKLHRLHRNKLSHSRYFSVPESTCFQDYPKGFTAVPSYSHMVGDVARGLGPYSQTVEDVARGLGPYSHTVEDVARGMGPYSHTVEDVARGMGPYSHTLEDVANGMGPYSHTVEDVARGLGPYSHTVEDVARGLGPSSQMVEDVARGLGPSSQMVEDVARGLGPSSQMVEDVARGLGPYSHTVEDVARGMGPYSHTVEDVARGLGHGNKEIMNLVQTAFDILTENASERSVTKDCFHASQIDTCCLPGLSDDYCNVLIGYTALVLPETAAIADDLQGKSLQILLLDGDLTETYHHLGYNCSTNLKTLSEISSSDGNIAKEMWNSRMLKIITQANISLILVRGDVCPILMNQCIHKNILIVTHVRQNVLQAFSESTGAEPLTYLTQFSQCHIGRGVYVNICTRGNSVMEVGSSIAITIKANKMHLVTVILTSYIASKIQIKEDQFWACTYRLHHALQDRSVFFGGGAVELLCLSHLRTLEDQTVGQDDPEDPALSHHKSSWMSQAAVNYKALIFRCLAKGWYKYLSGLLCNIGEYSTELDAMTFIESELDNISHYYSPSAYILNEYTKKVFSMDDLGLAVTDRSEPVYDNVIPKLEAWRRALHLVLVILQTDAEIITGSAAQAQISKGHVSKEDYYFL